MIRQDRVEQLLARDRELMAKLNDAPEEPELLRQRKQVKSHMNLYGAAAVERLLRQDFKEFTDAVIEREEEREARRARRIPSFAEKIRKLAVG